MPPVKPSEHILFSQGRSHRLPAALFRVLKTRLPGIQNQLFQTSLPSWESNYGSPDCETRVDVVSRITRDKRRSVERNFSTPGWSPTLKLSRNGVMGSYMLISHNVTYGE